ncbi:ParB N-terminal domain-containing protein [Nocardia sp. XZ_19_385]|uniref:ParB/RepB/Spo0J family partition protein n=1 Tax=Nocardia sp. XZ_19_385 TaxID=2769488 RepID=UPI0018907914|nr:ParB N-terminal domain-containing protein [Nocardia sp. XZ_19_385]
MARGKRTDLASLVHSTGANSPVDGKNSAHAPSDKPANPPGWTDALLSPAPLTSAPLADLVANPRNPREGDLNLEDLESIAELQLQPALVVSRDAYLRLWPEDEPELGAAKLVVINGCRRLAAAQKYGCEKLELVVKDEVAASRAALRTAAIRENVERENLDVIEEARAVEALVADCGTAAAAAVALGKTEAWVSQRRALLKLAPQLQQKLRAGELAIRVARNLAQVPVAEQVARWQASLAKPEGEKAERKQPAPIGVDQLTRSLKKWDVGTDTLAPALLAHLDRPGVHALIAELRQLVS